MWSASHFYRLQARTPSKPLLLLLLLLLSLSTPFLSAIINHLRGPKFRAKSRVVGLTLTHKKQFACHLQREQKTSFLFLLLLLLLVA